MTGDADARSRRTRANARTAAAGQAVTIETPGRRHELSTVRVPVQVTPTDVQYVANLQWVAGVGSRLASLFAGRPRRPESAAICSSAMMHQVVVTYDGSLSTAGRPSRPAASPPPPRRRHRRRPRPQPRRQPGRARLRYDAREPANECRAVANLIFDASSTADGSTRGTTHCRAPAAKMRPAGTCRRALEAVHGAARQIVEIAAR